MKVSFVHWNFIFEEFATLPMRVLDWLFTFILCMILSKELGLKPPHKHQVRTRWGSSVSFWLFHRGGSLRAAPLAEVKTRAWAVSWCFYPAGHFPAAVDGAGSAGWHRLLAAGPGRGHRRHRLDPALHRRRLHLHRHGDRAARAPGGPLQLRPVRHGDPGPAVRGQHDGGDRRVRVRGHWAAQRPTQDWDRKGKGQKEERWRGGLCLWSRVGWCVRGLCTVFFCFLLALFFGTNTSHGWKAYFRFFLFCFYQFNGHISWLDWVKLEGRQLRRGLVTVTCFQLLASVILVGEGGDVIVSLCSKLCPCGRWSGPGQSLIQPWVFFFLTGTVCLKQQDRLSLNVTSSWNHVGFFCICWMFIFLHSTK